MCSILRDLLQSNGNIVRRYLSICVTCRTTDNLVRLLPVTPRKVPVLNVGQIVATLAVTRPRCLVPKTLPNVGVGRLVVATGILAEKGGLGHWGSGERSKSPCLCGEPGSVRQLCGVVARSSHKVVGSNPPSQMYLDNYYNGRYGVSLGRRWINLSLP